MILSHTRSIAKMRMVNYLTQGVTPGGQSRRGATSDIGPWGYSWGNTVSHLKAVPT